jgi:hypothetical protein
VESRLETVEFDCCNRVVLLDAGGLPEGTASLMRLRSLRIVRPPHSLEGLDVEERTREEFFRRRRRRRRCT